jgi:PPOX class probable F420-dependent enzyme
VFVPELRLTDAARRLLHSDALAHVATVNPDGSPQVSCVWVEFDEEAGELRWGSLGAWRKVENLRRDPRVAITIESPKPGPSGMRPHMVLHGRARLTEGGAPELLGALAQVYVGPGTKFPPIDDPPPGVVVHVVVDRVGGVGDWTE